MDKIALQQGLKRVMYAIVLAFIGPFVIMQAFKNEGHPWYWPRINHRFNPFCWVDWTGVFRIRKLTSAFLGKKRKG